MKKGKRHLIILMAFALVLLAFDKPVKAQTYTAVFDISKGNVTFTSDRKYDGYSSNGTHLTGTHNNANKYKITGSVTSVSTNTYDAANGTHGISAVSNPYTVTIETINLVPTSDNGGNGNKGMTYDITLDNLTIDRSAVDNVLTWVYGKNQDTNYTGRPNFGLSANGLGVENGSQSAQTRCLRYLYESKRALSRPPFDAGDDTVEVILTLVGTNTLKGESGSNAALQYQRFDGLEHKAASGAYTTWLGVLGDKSLTIKGSGSLYVKKDGSQNAGAAIGAACIGTGESSSTNGHLIFESGTVTAATGGPGDYSVPIGQHSSPPNAWGYDGMIGHPSQFGSYAAAIGGGACGRCGHIEITGGTVNATSYSSTAAIGCGGGFLSTGGSMTNTIDGVRRDGLIEIKGGTVNTYSMGMMGSVPSVESAVGIGGGSCNYNSGNGAGIPSEGEAGAKIIISGGTVNVKKNARNDGGIEYVGGDIGGGHSNISLSMPSVFEEYWPTLGLTPGYGGDANVKITGGNISAGNIGGGCATHPGTELIDTKGGDALLTIDMTSGLVDLTGYIGGGNSVYKSGGDATVNVIKGTINAGSIGGGNSIGDDTADPIVPGDGNGGEATVTVQGGTLTVTGKIGGGYSHGSGAGGNASIYVTGGTLDCASIGGGDSNTGSPGEVSSSVSGRAGVHIAGSDKITVKSGYIGGGTNTTGDVGKATAYINATHSESTIQGQFILVDSHSTASDHCYFTLESGTIDNTNLGAIGSADYPRMKANGGAVYIEDAHGVVTIGGGTIQNCSGSTNGGAIYINGGSCVVQGGSIGASGKPNKAVNGGGIYANGGITTITSGNIQYNEASEDGGGIYANGGTVTVNYSSASAGKIHNNSAEIRGGGLFISSTGRLNLQGHTTLEYNHVPQGGLGGGVYLDGTVVAGNASSPSTIVVKNNYASNTLTSSGDIAPAVRSNIFLPNPTHTSTIPTTWAGVITVVNNGLNLANSMVGFSVRHNFLPVIYCETSSYLSGGATNIMQSNAVFEDSKRYTKYFANNPPSYYPNFIYLSANTWVFAVDSQPEGFDYGDIDTPEELAWLISMVNGHHGLTADDFSDKVVNITADLDMKANSWVPIGMTKEGTVMPFKGTFNGNGHTISNIYCSYLGNDDNGTGSGLGLFGTLENAVVKDVILHGVELQVHNQTSGSYVMGAIANEAKGTTVISGCVADAAMESTWTSTKMGGLVGKLTGGNIHSSFASPTMTGYQMGGLVGETGSGTSLKNSFANAKFTQNGTGYVGGLVGVNAGTVENCYVREQAGSSHGSNFGWCVGDNSGTIAYCYIPQGENMYKANGTDQGNTCTTYGPTATPYSYRHTDNQMAENANNAKIVNGSFDRDGNPRGLLSTLNKWVSDNSGHGYATWMRTMGSPINDDYPIFLRTDAVCVGSEDNVALEYSADFNGKFGDYIKANTGTIYLYSTPARLVVGNAAQDYNVDETNSGKNVQLHIGKGVSLVPNSGKAITNANVNVWLDNSAGTNGASPVGHTDAIDWHFFSSALTAAPIGLNYQNESQFDYGVTPPQAQFSNADGYFPLNLNSYYSEWDLYAYSEPEYHWINLKRNSASHWHEDFDHGHINYTNETTFTPGKGYMVALAEESYLQAYGTLNSHPDPEHPLEVSINYTPDISWTTRQGQNLLGNPYQSYLDFNEFASANSTLWNSGDNPTGPFYIVMDEDKADYVTYTVGQSANEARASRYLHPHQGFMVKADKAGVAKFHDGMRKVTMEASWTSSFRGDEPANYPLVNLFATDGNGNRDMVTVELGRPDKGGLRKALVPSTSQGRISCRYEGEDYDLAYTQPGLESANIRFSTDAEAAYTMTWDTQNGEFGYLHLVDNLTGADIDCLTASEYKFTSRTSDYASRFKLVFEYTGIEEQEDAEPAEGPTAFAYYANGEIHLTDSNDDASLQIIDMTGRTIASRDAVPASTTLSTDGMAAGIYVLRLTDRNGTRTQKMVIR